MNVTEKIKARIEFLKMRIRNISEDSFKDYYDSKMSAMENELDFLIEILDDIERKALKEESYNV